MFSTQKLTMSGSFRLGPTFDMAARWNTTATASPDWTEAATFCGDSKVPAAPHGRMARLTASASLTSPSMKSTRLSTYSALPVDRLSSTRTLYPSRRSSSARWLPMNPAPPVTSATTPSPLPGSPDPLARSPAHGSTPRGRDDDDDDDDGVFTAPLVASRATASRLRLGSVCTPLALLPCFPIPLEECPRSPARPARSTRSSTAPRKLPR